MKLSKREKILILILAGVITVFLYNKFIYSPQARKINELQVLVDELEKNKLKSMELLSSDNNIYQNYKILNSQVAIAEKSFYPRIIQEKIILQLDSIIRRSKLNVISLSFTEPEKKEIKENEEKKEEQSLLEEYANIYNSIKNEMHKSENESNDSEENNTEKKEDKTIKVEKMTANLVFQGNNYNELIDFLTQLELQEKRIVVENIDIKMNKELLSGTLALDYYSIPKITKGDEEYNSWNIYGSYGVDNPFTYFEGYNPNSRVYTSNNDNVENNQEASANEGEAFDFYMGLRPITADLPTVVIGKQDDIYGSSYIYGDNSGVERVEFQFIKQDNSYFYKYKTEVQSMPLKYEDEMVAFTPRGENIVMKIISTERKGERDNSGIYLSLINNTDLKLEVNIDSDISTKPRISIEKKYGDIEINRYNR